MRRVILLALLALALPTAALANSIDFAISGGTMTLTKTAVTINSNISGISFCNPSCPTSPSPTSGTITISLPPFKGTGGSFTSGSVSLTTAGGYVFNGTFTSGTWSAVTVTKKGKTIIVGYTFNGQATGSLTLNGHTIQTTISIIGGQTVAGNAPCPMPSKGVQTCAFSSGNASVGVVPEPGTLGLLGTGLIGLAGIVRRKFRA